MTAFSSGILIYDFTSESTLENWWIVNDGVMGGLSEGEMYIDEEGHAVFTGKVRLENNGGFTSIRYDIDTKNIENKTFATIRLKGDGKRYQFRVKTDRDDWFSYIYHFETSGDWETIRIPLAEMKPSFRGRELERPNYPVEQLSEITFLIANKKAESFRLEMDQIMIE